VRTISQALADSAASVTALFLVKRVCSGRLRASHPSDLGSVTVGQTLRLSESWVVDLPSCVFFGVKWRLLDSIRSRDRRFLRCIPSQVCFEPLTRRANVAPRS
jgi:hypothetical protein